MLTILNVNHKLILTLLRSELTIFSSSIILSLYFLKRPVSVAYSDKNMCLIGLEYFKNLSSFLLRNFKDSLTQINLN